jgi:hypothetical protein
VLNGNPDPGALLPFNEPVPVESEIFVGSIMLNVKGLPSTPHSALNGTRWLGKTVIQARRSIRMWHIQHTGFVRLHR